MMTRKTKVTARATAPEDKTLGQKIRVFRVQAGLSQDQLGKALTPPVSFQQIQKYEKGTNRVAHSKLLQICKALGVSVADMVSDLKGEGQTTSQSAEVLAMMGDHATYRLVKAFKTLPRDMQYKFISLVESVSHDQAA